MLKKFTIGFIALSTLNIQANENPKFELDILGKKHSFSLVNYPIDETDYAKLIVWENNEYSLSGEINNLLTSQPPVGENSNLVIIQVKSINSYVRTNVDIECPAGYNYKLSEQYDHYNIKEENSENIITKYQLSDKADQEINSILKNKNSELCLKLSKNDQGKYEYIDSSTPISSINQLSFGVNIQAFTSNTDKAVGYTFTIPEVYKYKSNAPIETQKSATEIKKIVDAKLKSLSQHLQIINH